MITRQEFPYLQELVINDAYAVKNLRVPVFAPGQEFKHLVLTGRNGSGKTTVLRGLHDFIQYNIGKAPESYSSPTMGLGGGVIVRKKSVDKSGRVKPLFLKGKDGLSPELQIELLLNKSKPQIVLAFFKAARKIEVQDVKTVTQESDIEAKILELQSGQSPTDFFKQFLVNKKIFQLFDTLDGKQEGARKQELFFAKLEASLSEIFHDPDLKLEFVRESFEFYLVHSDGRRITFNQLSAGFSAFLSILTELLMRVDLLRKQANDYSYDPCGFVLIDEPETHLHLEMQYQILPLLTDLFPNLQFIVATHSPAVASSIKNATVFDLSTGQVLGDTAAGSSFSELMQTHFGLENEYSNVADKILEEVTEISAMPDRAAALARLQQLLEEQGRYMSPVLRLDVQAHLLHLQREQAV